MSTIQDQKGQGEQKTGAICDQQYCLPIYIQFKTLSRKTLLYVASKQLMPKAVLMVATVFCDFWVTVPVSYTTDLWQLSSNMYNSQKNSEHGYAKLKCEVLGWSGLWTLQRSRAA